MKLKLTKLFATFLCIFSLGVAPAFLLQPTFAENPDVCNGIVGDAARAAAGCDSDADADLSGAIVSILNAVIAIAGIVAVVFIIIGGINYMTSAGDTQKVTKGKNTIIYACIGLIICALAFAIVNFVISSVLKQSSTDPTASLFLIEEAPPLS